MNIFKAAVTVEISGPDAEQVQAAMRKVSKSTRRPINQLLRLVAVKKNNVLFETTEAGVRPL